MNGRFRVIWRTSLIQNRLAALVLDFFQRGQDSSPITKAMAEIDRILETNPSEAGESRENIERILIVPPLTVTFDVNEEEQIVYILTLGYHAPSQG